MQRICYPMILASGSGSLMGICRKPLVFRRICLERSCLIAEDVAMRYMWIVIMDRLKIAALHGCSELTSNSFAKCGGNKTLPVVLPTSAGSESRSVSGVLAGVETGRRILMDFDDSMNSR